MGFPFFDDPKDYSQGKTRREEADDSTRMLSFVLCYTVIAITITLVVLRLHHVI